MSAPAEADASRESGERVPLHCGIYLLHLQGVEGRTHIQHGLNVFLVPTLVAPSAIQGVGVFAAGPIPAGTVIWEFTEGVDWEMSPDQLASFPEPWQTALRRWCYQDFEGAYILCGDNAKFMNHSGSPSCDDDGEFTVTARDLETGDELTCDYRAFDLGSRDGGLDF